LALHRSKLLDRVRQPILVNERRVVTAGIVPIAVEN